MQNVEKQNLLKIRVIYDVMNLIVGTKVYDSNFHDETGYLSGLACNMDINDQNETLDPAIWYEWLKAIDNRDITVRLKPEEYAEIERRQSKLTLEEGYAATIRFLTWYANSVDSDEIREFVQDLTDDKWLAAADKVLGQKS